MHIKNRKETKYIVIHAADTYASMDIGAEEIDRWHRSRGFFRIGYHYVIRRDGTVETGRELDQMGAHVRGHNKHSVGVCMVGGKAKNGGPEDNFTPEQFVVLADIVDELRDLYPNATVVGHNYLDKNKDCPCFNLEERLPL